MKNPNDPVWRKDPAVALYRSILKRFAPGAKATDVYHWYGMTVAWTMVDTLQRAGKNLTRAGLLRAARSLDTSANPFLLPGTRLRTSANGRIPDRHRLPVPLRQPAVGPHVRAFRRAMSASGPTRSPGARLGHQAPPPRRKQTR